MKPVFIIILCIAAVIVGYILFLIVCALFVDPKKEYDKNSRFYRNVLGDVTAIGLFLCGVDVKTTGLEKVPKDSRFLFVGNHLSNFDSIIQWHVLRKYDLAFISKPENFKIFIFGRLIRKCCFMAIDRQSPRNSLKTVDKAAELIKNDEVSIAVYPEGTRNKSYKGLLPFHNGMFKIAQDTGVPIVVAIIRGSEHIHKNIPFRRTKVQLDIVEVVSPQFVAENRRADLANHIRKTMLDSLGCTE
ncbi:MAG: 1-acyl-sn-glycerol-3-phosphate acyltransferase [Christensenellaceae bacterium]|nr:1-acyl-sn-glycerol-3-phosphate acyltransferase [Christensenellaceae bacterium]